MVFIKTYKEVRKQIFTSTLTCCPGLGQAELITQDKLLKQRKAVVILKTVKTKFRYNFDFCLCVNIVKICNQHDV